MNAPANVPQSRVGAGEVAEVNAVRIGREQRAWTQAELDYIERNLAAGYSYNQIADGLGRSRNAVAGAVRRMRGIPDKRRIAPAQSYRDAAISAHRRRTDQVAELLAQGKALTDISEKLCITRNAVKCAFKKIKRELGWQAR